MLSSEENRLLTETGPGTAGGDLFRRYWQPVALAEELESGAPVAVEILGEKLVLFRIDEGRLGLLGLHCSHRGADLSLGRIEDGGLRCLYHGWLYDVYGRCIEQPAELEGSGFKDKIRHKAYPCEEAAGVVFAYLGPGQPPKLPMYEPLTVPENQRYAYKVLHECNWLQAHEGEIDPTHLSFLHRRSHQPSWRQRAIKGSPGLQANTFFGRDASPTLEVEATPFGVRIATLRKADESHCYLRVSNGILPNISTISSGIGGDGYDINWHVPIDNERHWKYVITFRRMPLEAIDWKNITERSKEITPDYKLLRNPRNKYLQDRQSMKTGNFSGMGLINLVQDAAMVQGQGPIQDRTQEHVGSGDKAIITFRRAFLSMLERIREGDAGAQESSTCVSDIFVVSELISASENWREYCKKFTK
jgi:phenylpropionate dioxygenase-like ring-hydroxylating dioxygenase large terminal subunit